MFDKGLFGGMFDFNNDGKMDSFEKAAEFGFFMQMMDDIEKSDKSSSISVCGETMDRCCNMLLFLMHC